MHPESAPVAAPAFRIDVEYRLDVVIARRQLRQTVNRMPEGGLIYDDSMTGLKTIGVNAKNRHRVRPDLKARFRTLRTGDDQDDPASHRASPDGLIIRDLEPSLRPRDRAEQSLKENDTGDTNKIPHSGALYGFSDVALTRMPAC